MGAFDDFSNGGQNPFAQLIAMMQRQPQNLASPLAQYMAPPGAQQPQNGGGGQSMAAPQTTGPMQLPSSGAGTSMAAPQTTGGMQLPGSGGGLSASPGGAYGLDQGHMDFSAMLRSALQNLGGR